MLSIFSYEGILTIPSFSLCLPMAVTIGACCQLPGEGG